VHVDGKESKHFVLKGCADSQAEVRKKSPCVGTFVVSEGINKTTQSRKNIHLHTSKLKSFYQLHHCATAAKQCSIAFLC
jgi:hypothetical protein